ncbi:MAG: glycosyltransferase family 39 protein [Bacteroidales bacterium]
MIKNIFRHHAVLFLPRRSGFLFLVLILGMAAAYQFPHILTLRPQGLHQWRQCDCLAMTSRFQHGDAGFFRPAIHNLLNDGEGKTASEFPLIYWLVGMLWRVFGRHEWMFRMVNFLVSMAGMWAMFRILESRLRDTFWSLFAVGVFFTSSVVAYYSLNFLMNTTALSVALVGWYFFFRYAHEGRPLSLSLAMGLFLLAALLKMSAGMSFVALLGLYVWETVLGSPLRGKGRLFLHPLVFLFQAVLVISLVLLWLHHVQAYNRAGNPAVFLVGILPVWDLGTEAIREVAVSMWRLWGDYYFPVFVHVFLVLAQLFAWIFYRKIPAMFHLLAGFFLVGGLAVVVLFYQPLRYHDYYLTDLFILSFFVLLAFFCTVKAMDPDGRIHQRIVVKILAVLFLVAAVSRTGDRTLDRYRGWMNQRHLSEFADYGTLEPVLDSLGIGRDVYVISKDDASINVTLYLMDRYGWSAYGTDMGDSAQVVRRMEQGARVLLSHKEFDWGGQTHWNHLIGEEMGRHGNIRIYRLEMP